MTSIEMACHFTYTYVATYVVGLQWRNDVVLSVQQVLAVKSVHVQGVLCGLKSATQVTQAFIQIFAPGTSRQSM